MSEVFSEAFLLSRISHLSSSILNEKFIFFQINEEHGKAREDFFSRVLARVADKTHLRICLCPIGIAPGHSDQTPLSKMSSLLGDKSVFIKHPSIWDIMYLIKHSAMYIGTSLHGTITAMSFNVKFIAHGPVKLENYVETWCNHTSNRFIEDYSNLEENILDVLNKDDLCNSSYQKQKVKLSFDSIKKIMAQ